MPKSPIIALIANSGNYPGINRAIYGAAKLVQRTFPRSNIARKVLHAVRNWYEGGWPIWTGGEFSYLPSLIQDARWDQNYVTRRELMRRMRYWSQNSPLIEAILSVGERYTVGATGLHVSFFPTSDFNADADNSWYERADEVVHEWMQECGWHGESMEKLLKIGFRCQKIDGEIFYIKTHRAMDLAVGQSGTGRILKVQKPCLQMVEAHRVESPWNRWEDEGRHMIDGVQFTLVTAQTGGGPRESLEKVGYWMRNGFDSFEQNDSWQLIPATDVFHLYNAHRVNQYRGLSDFYACEVMLNKHEDTINIEMKAHSSQSVRSVGIETASGAAGNPLDKKIERIRSNFPGLYGNQQPVPNEKDRFDTYRRETGAYIYGLKLGEKIHFDSPNRPSDATLNLLEFQINCICSASKAPRCLVFQKISGSSAKAQGTEVRAELDSADAFYKSDFVKWQVFLRGAVIYFMEWAVRNDGRVADPPANWRDCIHIQPPEACNVDVGYTTQSDLMLLAAGACSYQMLLGRQGLSAIKVFKQLKREQDFIERNGIKVTLPALMPGQIPLDGGQAKPAPTMAEKE